MYYLNKAELDQVKSDSTKASGNLEECRQQLREAYHFKEMAQALQARAAEREQMLQDSQYRMGLALQELQELKKYEQMRTHEYDEKDQMVRQLEYQNANKEKQL
jgi:hypothetical protein